MLYAREVIVGKINHDERMKMKLEGKVALVTGAGSGMGRAISSLYAAEGASVVAADMNMESATETVEAILASGGQAVAAIGNVTSQADVDSMVDMAVGTYGTLDILVNNAGMMDSFHTAESITDDLWDLVMAVNATGPMRLIRKSLPIFLEKGSGIIVNMASVGGVNGGRAGVAYTASKHAIVGITRNVGFQYAPKGIRCNAIAPGAVNTNIGTTIQNPNEYGMGRAMVGVNYNPSSAEPEQIATIALFLASDDSSFVNGTTIVADAGWTAY